MKFLMYEFVSRKSFCFKVVLVVLTVRCDWGDCAAKQPAKKILADFNPATEDFRTLVSSGIYVDKTFLINETLKCAETVLQITRPRKWGKTMNLDMLRRFFEIEYDKNGKPLPEDKKINPAIFKGGKAKIDRKTVNFPNSLKISGLDDVMGHLGKHPVIYVSFKGVKGKNYQQFEESLRNIVVELFHSFPFLEKYMDDDGDTLGVEDKIKLAQFISGKVKDETFICCFEFLSRLLYKHFNSEVCILFDDYDFPIINAFLEFGDKNREFDSIVVMLRVIFENAFKENQYLLKGVISGTLNFFVVSSGISDHDYVGFHTVFDKPFSSFYGFSQKDIGELLGRTVVLFNAIELRKWYGGLHADEEEIYNPWSVMKSLSLKGKYDYFLQRSFTTDLTVMLDRAFLSDDMQEYLHLLIEGKTIVRSSLSESTYLRGVSGDFYSVFVHAGYLDRIAPAQRTDKPIWRLKIPNMDVRGIFATGVGKWVAQELKLTDVQFESFIHLLAAKDVEEFSSELQELLTLNECSDQTKEQYYHTLMGGIVSSLGMKFLVESIKDSGQNKGGNILIPYEKYGSVGLKIEYCISQDPKNLQTLVEASLDELLKGTRSFTHNMKDHEHVRKVMNLAMGFCGAKVLVKHKVVEN